MAFSACLSFLVLSPLNDFSHFYAIFCILFTLVPYLFFSGLFLFFLYKKHQAVQSFAGLKTSGDRFRIIWYFCHAHIASV